MVYSHNILPKSAAYYTLSNAQITGTELKLGADGYAEISVSKQMLPSLTEHMLLVVHPSMFSSHYTNDIIQVTLSVITSEGEYIEFLVPVSEQASGVFNTEITVLAGDYVLFTYRISSKLPVTVYNWELCTEEAADLTTVIDGVEQTVPKLLYDYNTYSYAVDQQELIVGLITCYLLQATDLQGHFTLSFFATERCNVHVRIKDNDMTELFTPQVYTVEKGYASISIPHAYLKKAAAEHAFAVTVQCTNGQLSIPVRGLLYTIDGGYLATRLMDAGVDVQDIGIKQLPTDLSPSEVWAIGFEGDRLILKHREYSQAIRANWVTVKDFGEGLLGRLEFPACWVNRNNSMKYTMETNEFPIVFILDAYRVLHCYTGSTFEEVEIIETDVTDASACQGFNSYLNITQDQGLILAYIKNGNAYYRQYLYNYDLNKYIWTSPLPLYEEGKACFISVHRLPDYRVGICIELEEETKWLITDRTYVGQAVKPEIIDSRPNDLSIISVLETSRLGDVTSFASLNNFEVNDENLYNGFTLTFVGRVVLLKDHNKYDLLNALIITVDGTVINSAELPVFEINNNTIYFELPDSVPGGTEVTIDLNFPYIVTTAYNNCFLYIEKVYTWLTPSPRIVVEHNELANIDMVPNLDVTMSELKTSELEHKEEIDVELDGSIDVTMNQLTTKNESFSETMSTTMESSVNIVVTLTGTTPI